MLQEFSDLAILEFIPVMRAICATLEIEVVDYPPLEKKNQLFIDLIEREFGLRKTRFAFMIFNTWLKGTNFIGGPLSFKKTNPEAKWLDMFTILRGRMQEYEDRLASKEKKKTEPIVQLPPGTGWEDLELSFKDGHTLTVFLKGVLHGVYDSTQLGFGMGNTKDKKVSKPWRFLNLLAICEQNRTVKLPVKSLFLDPLPTTIVGLDQIRGKLSEKLQWGFGIWEDPFYRYDPDEGYRLKFALKPEPQFRGSGKLHASGGELYEEKVGGVLEGIND